MHTRCPDCQTAFLITEQQLNAAGGKARCGRCGAVFDARAALLPEAGSAATPSEEATAGPEPAVPVQTPAPEPSETEPAAPAAAAPRDDAVPAVLLEDFAAIQAPKRRRRGWAWALLILFLSALLALQYAYFMRDQLVDRYPPLRPLLVRMCTALAPAVPCEVPLARDITQLRMLSSEVAEHPTKTGALLIQATFVNTATFAQPYPILEVKLSDLRGQPVGLRRFRPQEYLPPHTNLEQGMMPRTPVTALIEVARPFADVNNYRFAFY